MRDAQDWARWLGRDGRGALGSDRSEIIEVLSEAGLGQGHGVEWLLDRLTPGAGR